MMYLKKIPSGTRSPVEDSVIYIHDISAIPDTQLDVRRKPSPPIDGFIDLTDDDRPAKT